MALAKTVSSPTKPKFFASAAAFREWMLSHHEAATERWIGFYKKAANRTALTCPEAVDEALCCGWIDGIRKSVDEVSRVNRFTPRRRPRTND